MNTDEHFMRAALDLAVAAAERGADQTLPPHETFELTVDFSANAKNDFTIAGRYKLFRSFDYSIEVT